MRGGVPATEIEVDGLQARIAEDRARLFLVAVLGQRMRPEDLGHVALEAPHGGAFAEGLHLDQRALAVLERVLQLGVGKRFRAAAFELAAGAAGAGLGHELRLGAGRGIRQGPA